ncbi:DUF2306 domain-containing protein [Cellulomonas sp. S1-8]|uniref:DUF2306 domain-containing protein n=1 Tax=Cellulomonas sp. S1-8 TaxID=2904790 RepID=UPI0022435D9C|nr:DUF2306 domain-containing protein [Cellulomonas sp. S1-8]UZN02819.1 DUF2306 domain-containing protein [Cellulomonas sp. S1-8]
MTTTAAPTPPPGGATPLRPTGSPRTGRSGRAGRRRRRAPAWVVPTSLIAFSFIPIAVGSVRMVSLTGAVDVSDTLGAAPAPVPALVAHVVGITIYVVLGALQFHRGLRARRPRWHRWSGRVTAPAGIVAAVSGVWLALAAVGPHANSVLVVTRVLVGAGMVVALVLGVRAAVGRDFRHHRAWMVRAYALGQGAGTQVVVVGVVGSAMGGALTPLVEAVLFAAAWGINLAIGEWSIRRG